MGARGTFLDSADVQGGRSEVDLSPTKVHQFGRSQAVSGGYKGHRGVAVATAVAFGRRHEPLHLGLGQVVAGPRVLATVNQSWSEVGLRQEHGPITPDIVQPA
jgi:hypothetical protein